MAQTPPAPPYHELRPVRQHRWETAADDLVVVMVPKFTHRWLVGWFVPLLRHREMRVRLDEIGSFVWRECNGDATVGTIAARVQARFGGNPEDALRRVTRFFSRLAREQSLAFYPPGVSAPPPVDEDSGKNG